MWKNWAKYLLLVIAMVVFYIDYNGWISEYTFILTLCLPAFSLVCSLPSVWRLRIAMNVREKCVRNEDNDISISLKDCGIIDRAVLCKLSVKKSDMMAGTYSQENLVLSQRSKHMIPVSTEHCGIYKFQITRGRAYDFLGLFSFRVKLPKEVTVAVEPTASSPVPYPDFSRFRAQSFYPKPGGGFSEVHEMRQYRPGDPIKSIHWKLSAKTDDLIIREAQETECKLLVVTFDVAADRFKMDTTLDQLVWVSEQLLNLGRSHNVCYIDPDGFGQQSVTINNRDDLTKLIYDIMGSQIRKDAPIGLGNQFPNVDWLYHIEPSVREENV